jgi:hypothetical protein
MGETTMRLGRVTEPMVMGEKRLAGFWAGMQKTGYRVQGTGAEERDWKTGSKEQGGADNTAEPGLAGEVSADKKREASSRKRSLCGEPLNVGEG